MTSCAAGLLELSEARAVPIPLRTGHFAQQETEPQKGGRETERRTDYRSEGFEMRD